MEKILVLDFGGQYNQPIARKVREQNIYAEIVSYQKITVEEIVKADYKGVIFTGGPDSVFDEAAPHYDPAILAAGIPILGIGYGCQLIAYMAGGKVTYSSEVSEHGKVEWLLQNYDQHDVGEKIGMKVDPENIQIMHKPKSEAESAMEIDI